MSRGELLKRRRCRLLLVGMALGVFLPVFQPSWITVTAGVVGIAILALVYGRECRTEDGSDSTQSGTHM
jgi:Na+-translocating ferredoxin:NAD+ oxidoreductase RnfD subunit